MRRFCRLCACPVVDGGVQLSQVDQQKLSRWWLNILDTKFDDEDLAGKWICQFCSWDARFLYENSTHNNKNDDSIVWWPQHEDKIYKKYYQDDLLKSCFVQLENIPAEKDPMILEESLDIQEETQGQISNQNDVVEQIGHPSTARQKSNSKCIYCCRLYRTEIQLFMHINSRHRNVKIRCPYPICATKYFKNKNEIPDHVKNAHASDKNRRLCDYCDTWIIIKSDSAHMKKFHPNVAIRCRYHYCSSYFQSEDERRSHEKDTHECAEDKKKCMICDKYVLATCYATHMNKLHSNVLPVKCRIIGCHIFYKNSQEMEKHVQITHKAAKIGPCMFCGKKQKTKYLLNTHIRRLHADVALKCQIVHCGSYFKSQEGLDQHFQEKHARIEKKKNLQCMQCNYKCSMARSLERHISSAHSTATYFCAHCPTLTLRTTVAVKIHLRRVHLRQNKMKCRYCPTTFRCIYKFNNHLRTSSCSICEKILYCPGMLKEHSKICRLIYECEFCDRKFAIRDSLRHHKRMHVKKVK